MITDIFNTNRKYEIIYSDPPWPQTKGNKRDCRANQGRLLDYHTMPFQRYVNNRIIFRTVERFEDYDGRR